MNRKEYTLRKINLHKTKGLELGPLYSPILTKEEADIYYVDHMSTNDLKIKYKDEPVPLEEIVEVDYVLGDKTLKEVLNGNKFDYIIASHVVEHIPDIVSWFKDMSKILKNNGLVSLVIPDKRFTFDITRQNTRPADVMGAYLDKLTKTTSAQMFDYVTEIRDKIDPQYTWNNPYENYSKKPRYYSKEVALQKIYDNLKPDTYVDAHCSVFVPYSFMEIIKALIEFDLFDYEIVEFVPTPKDRLEFYVTFGLSNKSKDHKLNTVPKIKKEKDSRELRLEIESLKNEINEINNSKSMRITKPLRDISKIIQRLSF